MGVLRALRGGDRHRAQHHACQHAGGGDRDLLVPMFLAQGEPGSRAWGQPQAAPGCSSPGCTEPAPPASPAGPCSGWGDVCPTRGPSLRLLERCKPSVAFLPGFFTWVGAQSGPARGEDGGKAAGSVPVAIATFATVVTSLLNRLQDAEGSRAETYRELESVLWGDESHLQSSEVDRVIAVALEDLRAAQGGTASVRTAASDVLVALARSHLCDVVSALQGHLKALEETSEEFVLITLRNLATRYAVALARQRCRGMEPAGQGGSG
ncbi:uncharacterized protein LOC135328178 [Dromaius novaehollandiae]|uniref:uncharacterized protein LOC135328178 n=1 Tax=Dromaius novaehollandiae TaxID=8790 RepID=UPI00311E0059